MEMAKIIACDATECAYNRDSQCHAGGITVGGPADHMCDTFFPSSMKGGIADMIGTVGACKVACCQYNSNLECSAAGIRVGHEAADVDCLTFAPI